MKINILLSFAHWDEAVLDLPIFKRGKVRLMIDSGAFTNFTQGRDVVKLDDYIHFVKEHKSIIWQHINLDKINHPKESADNLRRMEAAGLDPLPVFTRTDGDGADRLQALRDMASRYEYICLGGLAGRLGRTEDVKYLISTARHLKRMGTRFHVLGCGSPSLLAKIRPYSADSSTSSLNNAFGRMDLFYRGKLHAHNPSKRKIAPEVLRAYNLSASRVASDSFWGPAAIVGKEGRKTRAEMNVLSFCRFQSYLDRRGVNYFQALVPAYVPYINDIYGRYYADDNA